MFKYVKYSFFVFAAGVLFTLGSTFAMMYVFPMLGGGVDVHSATIADMEADLGKPCSEIYQEAMEFVRDDVKDMIDIGLSGGDWIAVTSEQQREFIQLTDERVKRCKVLEFSASEKGYEWPDFSELSDLYGTLSMHTFSYNGEEPTSKGLNKTALERVVKNYNNLIRE